MNEGYIIVLILIGFGVIYFLNQILKQLNEIFRVVDGNLDSVNQRLSDINVTIWNVE